MPEQLEARLERLGRGLEFPETPDVVAAVAERLRAPDAERRAPRQRPSLLRVPRRALVLALLALLLLAGAVVAAVPDTRNALLELFGLRGATVEKRSQLPPAPPTRPLDLGTRTSLADARERLGFPPLVPAAAYLERPRVHVRQKGVPGGELALAYPTGPGLPNAKTTGLGLLVTEFRGDLAPELVGKVAGEATRVERLSLDDSRAIWIEGAPHFFFYRTPDGVIRDRDLRLAANVLLLQRGRLLVRLEGEFDRRKAVELARSLRALR